MLLLLRSISRQAQKTIFLSTHDLELALQVADTIWLMDRMEGLQIGTPHELAAQGALCQFIERGGGVAFDAETLSVRVLSRA
jgi:iron complex transport system ATP-binding protein